MRTYVAAPKEYVELTQKILDRTGSYPETKHIMKTEYGVII